MLRSKATTTMGMLVALVAFAVAATAQAANEDDLVANANATKATFIKTDPGMATIFARAPGYVVFPSVAKAAIGVGAAHGDGVVYQQGHAIGKATLTQVTVGAQLGGQEYSEVIFFQTPAALANFMKGNAAFSGQVSAVALKSGASADAKYRDGVAVFTAAKGGLMFEASVGGQKFGYEAFLTQP